MPSAYSRLVPLVGLSLSALIGCALIVPAVAQLTSENAPPPRTAFIGFAMSGDTAGAAATVEIPEIEPSAGTSSIRVYVGLSFSPAKDEAGADADTVTGEAPDFGGSIVLGGALAEAVTSCDDERFVVTTGLTYDDLFQQEQRVAIQYFENDDQATQSDDGRSEDPLSEDGLTAAASGSYSVIRPDLWYRYDGPWSLTSDNGDQKEFDGFFNYTTCDVDTDAMWSSQGVRKTFIFPAVMAASGRRDSEDSVLETSWTIRVAPSGYESLIRSDLVASQLESGSQSFSQEAESWSGGRASVAISSSQLVFEDRGAKQDRDVWIFIAGIGVSILGGLSATSVAWYSRRRSSTSSRDT